MNTIKEAISLLILATVVAFGANFISPKGIPLIGTWYDNRSHIELEKPPYYDPDFDSLLTMEDTFILWKSGKAVFIDTREPDEYAKGHILGAINLPFEKWDDYWDEVSLYLSPESKIVTYCGGFDCDISVDAARELKVLGYLNTYIFTGGYNKWLKLNLPQKTSDEQ